MDFQWEQEPKKYWVEKNCVKMQAEHGTNLFNGVSGAFKCGTFPFYYMEKEGDFRIRCLVEPKFQALYDLGSIVVYESEDKWMKLAYENSDTGKTSIVSIVTRERSDDCNGESVQGKIWLQICRKDSMFSMHWSEDGQKWNLARIFHLEMNDKVKVGVSAQCPTGESCEVVFSNLEITENPYEDIRNLK